jgi:hypothetical protein
MHTSVKKKAEFRRQSENCCTEVKCDSGLRNNYFDGKRLSTQSFRIEQKYGLERRRLLNRAIHGWGVVYGYAITPEPLDDCKKQHQAGKLRIGPGMALDPCGRELLQTTSRNVGIEDLIPIDEDGKQVDLTELVPAAGKYRYAAVKDNSRDCWLLSAHYAEQYNHPLDVKGVCQCEHREWDQICETVRFSLRSIDCEDCCCQFPCELNCECGTEPCADKTGPIEADKQASRAELPPPSRGGCRCLCQYVTNLKLGTECGSLCKIEETCGDVWVDLRHGVPLACVRVIWDEICDEWTLGNEVEACGPRRLVKRNDLLFDLVRGCDLTRIRKISWADWHRSVEAVPFEDFSAKFGDPSPAEEEQVTKFWVEFSRPVRRDTLRSDCFAVSVMSADREGGWRHVSRVPIVRVDTDVVPPEPDDLAGYVRGGRIVVDGSWLGDAVRGGWTLFQGAQAWVEIEIRGDFILDCNGQTVDANAIGLSPYPSGNGTPGGTFLSCFRVAPAPDTHYRRKGA